MRPLLLTLLCLLVASSARATTAIRASIEQLAEKADAVVRARCISSEAAFTGDRSTIETRVRLAVLETVAGSVPAEPTVLCRGGRVGSCALRVRGQPTFAPGEETFLFLRRDPHGDWRVLGWSQGKFRIVRDPESGSVTAIQDLTGLCLVGPTEGAPVSREPERLTLDDLVRRVRAARATDSRGAVEEGDEKEPSTPGGQVAPPKDPTPGESPPTGK